jgi:hypothetical protein
MSSLYRKYSVTRLGDLGGKHDHCDYFVLDLTHDDSARKAAMTYAVLTNNGALLRELAALTSELQS